MTKLFFRSLQLVKAYLYVACECMHAPKRMKKKTGKKMKEQEEEEKMKETGIDYGSRDFVGGPMCYYNAGDRGCISTKRSVCGRFWRRRVRFVTAIELPRDERVGRINWALASEVRPCSIKRRGANEKQTP